MAIMRLKVIFGHPKWPPAAILLKKIKVAYWSEMARNVIKSDFRSSKMAKKIQKNKSCVLIWNSEKCDRKWFSIIQNGRRQPFCEKKVVYWSETARNAIESDFQSSKMAVGSHFVEKKSCVLIWNDEKCDRKWFSVIQNGRRQPFCEQNKKLSIDLNWREMRLVIQNGRRQPFCEQKKSKLRIALKWREVRSKFIFGHPKWGGGGASQWPACKPFGDIHSVCPWANTPILVFIYSQCIMNETPLLRMSIRM